MHRIEDLKKETKVLVVMATALVMLIMETFIIMDIKEDIQALALLVMLFDPIFSLEVFKEIIKEEKETGTPVLVVVVLTMENHLETQNLNGIPLSQLVKSA